MLHYVQHDNARCLPEPARDLSRPEEMLHCVQYVAHAFARRPRQDLGQGVTAGLLPDQVGRLRMAALDAGRDARAPQGARRLESLRHGRPNARNV
jgi:hypothetical protein